MKALIKHTFIANFVIAFTISVTASTVMLQVMQSLGELTYNVANIFTMFASMVILKVLGIRLYRKRLLNYIPIILVLDVIFFAVICGVTLYSLELRWVLMMVVWPFFSKTGQTLMDDIINRHLNNDDLTDFKTGCQFWSTSGTVVAFTIAAILNVIDIPLPLASAVVIQFIGIVYATWVDFKWVAIDKVVVVNNLSLSRNNN